MDTPPSPRKARWVPSADFPGLPAAWARVRGGKQPLLVDSVMIINWLPHPVFCSFLLLPVALNLGDRGPLGLALRSPWAAQAPSAAALGGSWPSEVPGRRQRARLTSLPALEQAGLPALCSQLLSGQTMGRDVCGVPLEWERTGWVPKCWRGSWGRGGLQAGGPAGNGAVGMAGHTCQTAVMPPGAGSQAEEGAAPRLRLRVWCFPQEEVGALVEAGTGPDEGAVTWASQAVLGGKGTGPLVESHPGRGTGSAMGGQ